LIQDAGIKVVSGVLENDCINLNKRFFTYHEKKRPFIVLKWAQSSDGFIDKDFKPTAVSNSLVNQFVHQLRADEHSILVGTQTVLNDNPSLTVRNVSGENPVRILIDFDLKVPLDFKIYNSEAKTLVFNLNKEKTEKNIHFIKIEKEDFLSNLMDALYKHQIQSVIIEGGNFTLQKFIEANLWDEAIIIKNENLQLQNGTKAPDFQYEAYETENFRDNLVEFHKNS